MATRFPAPLLVGLVLCLACALPVQAVTFVVNSTADAVDENPGHGKCLDGPQTVCEADTDCTAAGLVGPCARCDTGRTVPPASVSPECTLRAAIQEANASAGADTIVLPPGTYVLTLAGAGEDDAANGDLDITDALTLNGAGADRTIINGVSGDRVLHVDPHGALIDVAINGVTVQNGSTVPLSFVHTRGAGILLGTTQTLGDPTPSGTLTITDCVVQGNTSEGYGGGVGNLAGTLIIVSSTISGNRAHTQGGGIINDFSGTTILIESTVRDNVVDAGAGGGISSFGARVTVVNSTISGNADNGTGGGALIYAGSLELTNSTVSDNSHGLFLYNEGGGPHTLSSSTIADNDGPGIVTSNSGVGAHPITLRNTIVANNAGPDCVGTLLSQGHNLIRNLYTGIPGSPPVCFFAATPRATSSAKIRSSGRSLTTAGPPRRMRC